MTRNFQIIFSELFPVSLNEIVLFEMEPVKINLTAHTRISDAAVEKSKNDWPSNSAANLFSIHCRRVETFSRWG